MTEEINFEELCKKQEESIKFLESQIKQLVNSLASFGRTHQNDLRACENVLTQLIEVAVKRRLKSDFSSIPSREESLLQEVRSKISNLRC